jgi:hypothetical protein
MDDRIQFLRQQITHYRRLLTKGVAGELAHKYRAEIAKAETELAEIEKDNPKPA